MSVSSQVVPVTVREQLVQYLRAQMVAGKLRPGDRIVELRIARQLGLGTTSVREALYVLEKEGFVTRITNKGAYVTQLSVEDRRQIYRVRIELEGLAAELVARAETQKIADLQSVLDEMRTQALAGNLPGFYEADLNFHRRLWAASGNKYIAASLEGIVAPLFAFYVMRTSRDQEQLIREIAIHQAMLDGIRTGDPQQARQAMADRLRYYQAQEDRFLKES
jgi:DNA-binding GntR family transcriptional regulator